MESQDWNSRMSKTTIYCLMQKTIKNLYEFEINPLHLRDACSLGSNLEQVASTYLCIFRCCIRGETLLIFFLWHKLSENKHSGFIMFNYSSQSLPKQEVHKNNTFLITKNCSHDCSCGQHTLEFFLRWPCRVVPFHQLALPV